MDGKQTACRLCKATNLTSIIDLGKHPLADTFLKREQLKDAEITYPLGGLLCEECGFVMSSYVVSQDERYQKNDYSYDSSNSKVAISHFNEMASQAVNLLDISKSDLVVDIGSNVGTLLNEFRKNSGCNICGVEPSHNIAQLARENDIPTVESFFNTEATEAILKAGKAKCITMTNAFNHISELDAFMENLMTILSPQGTFVIEVPYLLDLVQKTSFDTMYLEHVSYFSIQPLSKYFKKFGLNITHIETNTYMGGSVRVYAQKGVPESALVAEYSTKEVEAGLYKPETYESFMERVRQFRFRLCNDIYATKMEGGKIVGIGAATKGNTLLNYCKIDSSLLEYITDSSALKIGKYTPGSHIVIKSDDEIGKDITHALILPWNIAEFLKSKLEHLGLTFLTPQMDIPYEN